jgi:hypothetical protein
LGSDGKGFFVLVNLEVEVCCTKEKVSGMRGETENLIVAVASVLILPGFEKCISEVGPPVGILRVLLEGLAEHADGLIEVFPSSRGPKVPSSPNQGRGVAEKKMAQRIVDLYVVWLERLRKNAGRTIDSQNRPEGNLKYFQIGTHTLLPNLRGKRSTGGLSCAKAIGGSFLLDGFDSGTVATGAPRSDRSGLVPAFVAARSAAVANIAVTAINRRENFMIISFQRVPTPERPRLDFAASKHMEEPFVVLRTSAE